MNSLMACRYPRLDSGERRLSTTAALLWSRSGRASFDFGRFNVADFRLARLLIPAASRAAGRKPTPAHRSVARFSSKCAEDSPTLEWHNTEAALLGQAGMGSVLLKPGKRIEDQPTQPFLQKRGVFS